MSSEAFGEGGPVAANSLIIAVKFAVTTETNEFEAERSQPIGGFAMIYDK
jgi:hypothetical protein